MQKKKNSYNSTVIFKWAKELNSHLIKEDIQMVDKCAVRCSISYAIREMQIKTTVTYHYTPIRMAKIQKHDTTNAGEDVEQQKLSFIAGRKAKWYSHLRRQFDSFS